MLLVLSIYLFLRGSPFWASAPAAIAAVLHPTYLPSAAVLTATYVALDWYQERRTLRALGIGLLALVIVLPTVLYSTIILGPTAPDVWARAQSIIVNEMLPKLVNDPGYLDRLGYEVTSSSGRPMIALSGVTMTGRCSRRGYRRITSTTASTLPT